MFITTEGTVLLLGAAAVMVDEEAAAFAFEVEDAPPCTDGATFGPKAAAIMEEKLMPESEASAVAEITGGMFDSMAGMLLLELVVG
jgi:hypothetical protein